MIMEQQIIDRSVGLLVSGGGGDGEAFDQN